MRQQENFATTPTESEPTLCGWPSGRSRIRRRTINLGAPNSNTAAYGVPGKRRIRSPGDGNRPIGYTRGDTAIGQPPPSLGLRRHRRQRPRRRQ